MSPHIILMLAITLVSVAGCAAGTAKPMEAPMDMNLAEADASHQENPFAKAFIKRDLPAPALKPDPAGPKIYRGEDQVSDHQRMLENGYDMIGSSEFIAGADVSPDLLQQHAKEIKADLALVYTRLAGEVPASVQVQQMREQAKTGEQPDAMQSESQDSYKYFATYWAKLAPPLLGVHVMGPAEDSETDGLRILAVINGSPADKAGLRVGDVLKRLGEVPLKSPSALTQAVQRYAGQRVEVHLQRGQNVAAIPVELNQLRTTASK